MIARFIDRLSYCTFNTLLFAEVCAALVTVGGTLAFIVTCIK